MNFLIDQPVSPLLAEWLRQQGHDACHARERGLSAAPDTHLVAVASAESRILVTADLDYARILALSGRDGPGLILFRAGNITDAQIWRSFVACSKRRRRNHWGGALSSSTNTRCGSPRYRSVGRRDARSSQPDHGHCRARWCIVACRLRGKAALSAD